MSTSKKPKGAANIRKPALPWQTSDMSIIRKTKRCWKHPKSKFSRAKIRYVKHAKIQKVLQTSENQHYQGEHPKCQTSEKPKSAANMRKAALPGRTTDMSTSEEPKGAANMRKPENSFTRANIRYVEHPKIQKVLQTSENQLYQGEHPISQTSEKPKSAANIGKPTLPGQTSHMLNIRKTKKCCKKAKTSLTRANIRYVEHPKNEKVMQTSENQLYQGEQPICQHPKNQKVLQTCENQKTALLGQTSDMSNIRKFKKCCKHPKTSFTRANIRNVKHPKNQKKVQTCENQLYQGKHPICQTSEKPKSAANMRKPENSFTRANIRYVEHPKIQKELQTSENQLYQGEHPICQTSEKPIKGCKHAKTSFTRANIRYVKHPKNQKVLQKSEIQLYQGEHPICQTSEIRKSDANIRKPAVPGRTSDMSTSKKPKGAANIRKPTLPWQTSEMSNIRKTKRCWKHPKSKFSRANIRYVKHPKNQKVLHTCENQLYQGKHPICQTSKKPKSAAKKRKPALPGRTSDMSNIRNTKSDANIRKPAVPGRTSDMSTSKKPKGAANIRKPTLPWQTSEMSNIRKTKRCWKHPKTSFTRANIRYVKHPKNQKVLHTCENQLYQGKHPICQTSKKPKSAANMRKPALLGQTSDISNIRKTKRCWKHPKSKFSRANIRYVIYAKIQKVLQTSENQLYQGEHPICRTSEKRKSAANIRKPALPGQTSDMSKIRKTEKYCKQPRSSFSRANIRYVKHPKNQKVLHTCENQLYQGKHQICRTSENSKSAANIRKPALPGRTSDMSNIRKTEKCCKHAKISFTRANIRYVKHPKNQKMLQT